MNSAEAAWVAGLLEGEAAFTKYVDRLGRGRIGIVVSSVDRDVLEQLERFVPEGAVHGPYGHPAGSVGKRPFWTYHLHARAAVVGVLEQIRPRMGARRTVQIDALLELHATHPPRPKGRARTLKTHGTRTRFKQGCRCGECREAENAYHREWKAAKRRAHRISDD